MAAKYFSLTSTKPGKAWQLYAYKPQGRLAYAVANEGEVTDRGGYAMFTFLLGQDRVVREPIEGAATLKKKKAALHALVHKLVSAGMVLPESALEVHGQIDAAAAA